MWQLIGSSTLVRHSNYRLWLQAQVSISVILAAVFGRAFLLCFDVDLSIPSPSRMYSNSALLVNLSKLNT